ncbi:endonuclease MutS2 [Candidatus Neomarinimicrobiota bacterium]
MPDAAEIPHWSDSLRILLHLDQTLEQVADYAVTGYARQIILKLPYLTDEHELGRQFDNTMEIMVLLEQGAHLPLSEFPDPRPFVKRTEVGGVRMSTGEFVELRALLQAASLVHKFLHELTEAAIWTDAALQLDPWPEGIKAIDRIIDEDGAVRSDASPALMSIRKSISRKTVQLRKRLDQLHGEAKQEGWGQDEPVAWRDGRLVLALKSSHKRKIKGLIHGQSSSGATAFVEPLEIFDTNNEIDQLRENELAEIDRILALLTDQFRPSAEAVKICFQVLVQLDIFHARARWAYDHQAVRPTIIPDGTFSIKEGRNPVLAAHREVVPMNLALGDPERLLLISGPNAGGKTVVLLTTGLFTMLAHCGLYIPAEEVTIPLINRIHADLGDHQSLEDDLSTFSAHLTNLWDILQSGDQHSLVLLDELGTGTDPEAGAALGQTFLEQLHSLDVYCMATTHLNRLKIWAQDDVTIQNAGMEFDASVLSPTYRLNQGRPGASYAMEIARRLGLPKDLISRAESLLPEASVGLEELLFTLEEDRQRLSEERAALKQHMDQIERQAKAIAVKEKTIKSAHRNAKRDALREAEAMVNEFNRRLEATVRDVRQKGKELSSDDIKQAKTTIKRERDKIDRASKELRVETEQVIPTGELKVGSWVTIEGQGGRGEIIKMTRNKDRATVLVGAAKLSVTIDQLQPAAPPDYTGIEHIHLQSTSSGGGYQLDLRGERGDVAIAKLLRFIDQAVLANLGELEIIHGMGTGILQKLVHEALDGHPQVASFSFANFDAGGTGATIVTIR